MGDCMAPSIFLNFSGLCPIKTNPLHGYVCMSAILWPWRWNCDCLRWFRVIYTYFVEVTDLQGRSLMKYSLCSVEPTVVNSAYLRVPAFGILLWYSEEHSISLNREQAMNIVLSAPIQCWTWHDRAVSLPCCHGNSTPFTTIHRDSKLSFNLHT
jgi:hypothetical protein